MQISSVLDIIDGRLLNQPSISFIYSVKTNPKKVREGDLFIALNKDDISLALEHGAFAIVVDKNILPSDNEIAWIKVNSLENAMIKLIRFLLSNIRLTAFYCNDASYELFKILRKPTVHTNIKIVPSNIAKFFKFLDDIEQNDTLICSNQLLLDSIYPVNFNFNTKKYDIYNLVEHSIFETTFSFEETYFSKLKISSLYITEFLDVYTYLGFNADLNKLKKFQYLKPIFVDKLINPTEFGRTDKFLIAQKNNELVIKEVKYLENKYKYGKVLYISTNDIDDNRNIDYTFINSLEELKCYLKKASFNAVYFIGVSYDELFENISKQKNEPSLI